MNYKTELKSLLEKSDCLCNQFFVYRGRCIMDILLIFAVIKLTSGNIQGSKI